MTPGPEPEFSAATAAFLFAICVVSERCPNAPEREPERIGVREVPAPVPDAPATAERCDQAGCD